MLLSIAMSFGTFTASKKKYTPSLCKRKELQIILRIYQWLQLNNQRPLRTWWYNKSENGQHIVLR